MSDITATADAYVATWNETDPAKRRAAIGRVWTDTGVYRDPLMASDGPAGINAMIAGVQGRFAGFVLKRTSRVDSHNGSARFAWLLGPAAGPTVVEGSIFAPWPPTGGSPPSSVSSTKCRPAEPHAGPPWEMRETGKNGLKPLWNGHPRLPTGVGNRRECWVIIFRDKEHGRSFERPGSYGRVWLQPNAAAAPPG